MTACSLNHGFVSKTVLNIKLMSLSVLQRGPTTGVTPSQPALNLYELSA